MLYVYNLLFTVFVAKPMIVYIYYVVLCYENMKHHMFYFSCINIAAI